VYLGTGLLTSSPGSSIPRIDTGDKE
jgi:hypothetical protein